MKKNVRLLTCCFIFAALSAQAEIVADNAYVRGLPPGVANTSAYMALQNESDKEVALVRASSSVSETATLHNTMNHDGMMHMMPVESAIIPAHGELLLESGGLHLMLNKLHKGLPDGAQVTLLLEFSDGTTLEVIAPVRSVLHESH